MEEDTKAFVIFTTIVSSVVLGLIAFSLWFFPVYGVWSNRLSGEAKLREAEWSRQIAIQEASAKEESAKHLAQAEIERAKGVAEANKIIGQSLKGNESYLHYLWIHALGEGQHSIVYVPTEAGLPILEASRFGVKEK